MRKRNIALAVTGTVFILGIVAVKNNPLINPVRIKSEKIDTLLCNILLAVFPVFMLV
jgi:hypothetical protein